MWLKEKAAVEGIPKVSACNHPETSIKYQIGERITLGNPSLAVLTHLSRLNDENPPLSGNQQVLGLLLVDGVASAQRSEHHARILRIRARCHDVLCLIGASVV